MGVKILTVNANGDSAKQAADVEDLITKKVDAIIINPRDAEAIAPSVQKALDAGIPVFALDRGVTGVDLTGFLETDNVAMGRLAADLIAEALFEKYGKVEGEVIELGGLVGTTAARDREQGFHERLEAYPGINLVASQPADFNQEKAYNVTTNLMLANPNVDAIYGGALCFSGQHRHHLAGVDVADSVVIGPQKWMYVPRVCAVVLFRAGAEHDARFGVSL